MKVLVISLLRLGDLIQILPVLNALRSQFSIRELDVLTHKQVSGLQPMVPGVDRWWTIDREQIQQGLGRADIPLLTSFSLLREQLDTINSQGYDCVINLSQTVFSGWIAGYLQAPNRAGLMFDVKGQAYFHSPWFQYLDDFAPLEVADIFNYTDIFFYGCGLQGGERKWELKETASGRAEVDALNLPSGEKIALQIFTSDPKKTWEEEAWLKMLVQLQLFRPKASFVLLAGPGEETRLKLFQERAKTQGLRIQPAAVSLSGALTVLKRSQLLITGDTSIKHLANAVAVPVLELSLGSSDWRRTGAYKPNSLILQPALVCAPCPHSAPCSQTRHECGLQLSPEIVSSAAHQLASHNWLALKELAEEVRGEVQLLRTRVLSSGFWMAFPLAGQKPETLVAQMVDRCSWKFILNREHQKPVAQFGTEGVNMKRELDELQVENIRDVSRHLTFLESEVGSLGEKALSLLNSVKRREHDVEEIRSFIKQHEPQSGVLEIMNQLGRGTGPVIEIGSLRRVHNQLERLSQQSQVKIKLIRCLKSQLMEQK